MVRLLRWGTFIVLLLVIVGAALSYPLLRDRFFGPMLAAPAQTVATEPILAQADTVQPTTALATTALAATANATDATFARPTMPVAQSTATIPALIISAPSPTAATAGVSTIAPSTQDALTAAPLAVATTSLLPTTADATITPMALGPSTSEPTAVKEIAESLARAVELPNSTTAALTLSPTDGSSVTTAVTVTVIAEVITVTTTGVRVTATTAAITTGDVTPIVVTAIELTPQPNTPQPVISQPVTPELPTPTPQPVGPIANAISPLYSGPDFDAAIVGQTIVGQELTIVGLYTEGAWYLLVNGLWLPGAVVDNAPLAMPLVFPTMTPVPSPTPTVTFTPLPSATPTGSATPTPTPTSLDAPVCDCSGDNLDCLGNIFANRAKAQQCFEYCFRQTGLDIHLLDPNLNGMACENLP